MDSHRVKLAGLMKVVLRGEHHSGESGPGSSQGEGHELGLALVDAHGLAGHLVLAQGDPGPSDPRILQPVDDEDGKQGQTDHEEIDVDRGLLDIHLHAEESRSWNIGDTAGTEGEFIPVFHDQAYDFTESQGNDGQIIPSQPQHGKAQNDAEHGRQSGTDGQYGPEAEPEMVVEQGVRVGTDAVKGSISQVQQSGDAHHDVESQPQQDIYHGRDHDVGLVDRKNKRKRQGYDADDDQGRHGEPAVFEQPLAQGNPVDAALGFLDPPLPCGGSCNARGH